MDCALLFCLSLIGKEQQKNSHPGEGGEHKEEALPGVPAQHGQAAQAGDLCRHQKEV